MSTRHNDILNAISRMMWLSTTGVAEAIEPLGYGGGKSWNDYRDMISKDLGYLQKKGLITGEDRPQTKGKPMRYWSLTQSDHSDHSLEMASDITEINHESIVETQESDAHENTDDAPQTAAADAVPLSNPTEAQAGWSPEAIEHPGEVLGVPVQAGHEAQNPKPATMPVGIAIAEFGSYSWKEGTTLAEVFMTGIAFAEEYHKIGPNENGDYL